MGKRIYTVPQIVFSDLSDMENAEVIIAQKRESLTKKQYRVGTWPLFDVEITKLKNKYILHISLDMLVADFVSINVILNEFEEVYYVLLIIRGKNLKLNICMKVFLKL